jgi:uncharacterized protein
MCLTFHGGEPTLIGVKRFEKMVQKAQSILGNEFLGRISIQTNGVLLSPEWARVLRDYDIVVGISLDGPAEIHNRNRPKHDGKGSYNLALRGLELLQDAEVSVGILCVIDPLVDGLSVYRHFRQLGVSIIDFLLPDVTHDTKKIYYPIGHSTTPVASYLIPIFEDWFSEDNPDIRIRIFWNLLRQLLGGTPETDGFGNLGMSYAVIESNGDIEALDALKVCAPGINSSGLNIVQNGLNDIDRGNAFVRDAVCGLIPLPTGCASCREKEVCAGGYLPHRYSHTNGFNNPSVWCSDILRLIGHIRYRVS